MKICLLIQIALFSFTVAFITGHDQNKITSTAWATATVQETMPSPAGAPAGSPGGPPAGAPAGTPSGGPGESGPGGNSATETRELTGTSADINGKFKVPLPMPGGTKDSTFILACDGKEVTGTITSPSDPAQICKIYNGKANGNRFSFSAMVGKTEFSLEGTAGGGRLSMTLTTQETIPLDDGTKIRTSKETGIDGAYLVPVYSPGGIMENIFFIKTEGNTLTGQMIMISNPLRDTSQFFDGTVNGKEVSFYTRTTQSLFHFVGTIEEEKIKLKLLVTDVRKGIEGSVVK